jgi:hypothetical protein
MRALFAIVTFAVVLAGLGDAGAADFAVSRAGYAAGVARAGQVWVYDNQPGVYVRAYWAAPWQNRHYFPFTGKKPKVGRRERLSDVRPAPKPADTYYREWSTNALYPPVQVRTDIGEPDATPHNPPLAPLE